MTTMITRMNPSALFDASSAGYSQISIAEPGRMAVVSGQVAWRASGEPVPASLDEQAAIVIGNLKAALEALEATPRDIVNVRLYVVDLTEDRVASLWQHLHEFFAGEQPSLTGIGVSALAAPDLQLEIEMTVRMPS